MPRQGRDARRAQKRAREVVEAELSREAGDYVPPARADCTPSEWYNAVDDAATLRISVWIWRIEGRLADFVIVIEEGDWSRPDEWVAVSRIDCCRGRCHIHPPDRMSVHVPIYRLDNIDDVENAFTVANSIADRTASSIRDRRS